MSLVANKKTIFENPFIKNIMMLKRNANPFEKS